MVYLNVEGSDWPYMKNADHTLTLRLGEIVGVLQNEEIDTGLYSWTVLTIDNGKKSAYEFYGASAEDIFNGDAYPIDIITYLRWRIENGYVIMPGPGVNAVYTIDQNKVLSNNIRQSNRHHEKKQIRLFYIFILCIRVGSPVRIPAAD